MSESKRPEVASRPTFRIPQWRRVALWSERQKIIFFGQIVLLFGALQASRFDIIHFLNLDFFPALHNPIFLAAVNLMVSVGGAIGSLALRPSGKSNEVVEQRSQKRVVRKPAPSQRPIALKASISASATGAAAAGVSEQTRFRRAELEEPYWLVSENLNTRVVLLQKRATAIYWTILAVIVSGVILVIFSTYLSSLDPTASTAWAFVDSERYNNEATQAQRSKIVDALISRIGKDNSSSDERKNGNGSKSENDGLTGHGTILRIVIISLIVFLVQILMQLYRYNSRLIAFYGSRRDALLLAKGESMQAKAYADLLAPEGLDFGKEPNHPLLELLQTIFRRRGTEDSKQSPPKATPGKPGSANRRKTGIGAGMDSNQADNTKERSPP